MKDETHVILYKAKPYILHSNGNWVEVIEKFIKEELGNVFIRITPMIWNTPEGGILLVSMKDNTYHLKDID